MSPSQRSSLFVTAAVSLISLAVAPGRAAEPAGPTTATLAPVIASAHSGAWSSPGTWRGGVVPGAGARVIIRPGHAVRYDVRSDQAVRSIHIAGKLSFARDRDTRLDVGLLRVQPGEDTGEEGFTCDAHLPAPDPTRPRPVLELGTPDDPIPASHTALIRLVAFPGMDPESLPAIVCCGGRMEFHGAPLSRTWVKLGATATAGSSTITLAEPVTGWRVGDRIIVTATERQRRERGSFRPGQPPVPGPPAPAANRAAPAPAANAPAVPSGAPGAERAAVPPTAPGRPVNPALLPAPPMPPHTEERVIRAISGTSVTLDQPLVNEHLGAGGYRGEVADLSRSVIVESADPKGVRGHTMFHRGSAGSISYAEFRHLGKEGVLGRYSLHFHLIGDTMRGSSVIGASIWDSGNRWLTVHGTSYLVVRDCVGYQSVGHGFYVEDGTEAYNVFDRNLAVQAFGGKPLPKQNLPFDDNSGAGFWWANSRNTFTRNVATECDRYGYRFEATPTAGVDLRLPVLKPDGSSEPVDIRTLPFIRFEGNEAHSEVYGINLGEGVDKVGPDPRHPFVLRDTRIWNTHWAFRPNSPSVLVDKMCLYGSVYGVYRPVYDHYAFSDLEIDKVEQPAAFATGSEPEGVQFPKPIQPAPPRGPITPCAPITVTSANFPRPLDLVDDLPPATIVTSVARQDPAHLRVRGTTTDNGVVKRVVVNGREAKALAPNFAEWEITLPALRGPAPNLSAHAEDAAGNIERTPHILPVSPAS